MNKYKHIVLTLLLVSVKLSSFSQDLGGVSFTTMHEQGITKLTVSRVIKEDTTLARSKEFDRFGNVKTEFVYSVSKRTPATKTTYTYDSLHENILISTTERLADKVLLYTTYYSYTDAFLTAKKSIKKHSKNSFKQVKVSHDSLGRKILELYVEGGYSYSKTYAYQEGRLARMILLKKKLKVDFSYKYLNNKLVSVTVEKKKGKKTTVTQINYFYNANLLQRIELDGLSYFFEYEKGK